MDNKIKSYKLVSSITFVFTLMSAFFSIHDLFMGGYFMNTFSYCFIALMIILYFQIKLLKDLKTKYKIDQLY